MFFELYRDKKGEYRWRLKAHNLKIIATSGEGYHNKKDCRDELEQIKKHAAEAKVIEIPDEP